MSTLNPLTKLPSAPSGSPGTSATLSNGIVQKFVFALAALILLGLSKIIPTSAALLAIAITLAVLFKDVKQFNAVSNRIAIAFQSNNPISTSEVSSTIKG